MNNELPLHLKRAPEPFQEAHLLLLIALLRFRTTGKPELGSVSPGEHTEASSPQPDLSQPRGAEPARCCHPKRVQTASLRARRPPALLQSSQRCGGSRSALACPALSRQSFAPTPQSPGPQIGRILQPEHPQAAGGESSLRLPGTGAGRLRAERSRAGRGAQSGTASGAEAAGGRDGGERGRARSLTGNSPRRRADRRARSRSTTPTCPAKGAAIFSTVPALPRTPGGSPGRGGEGPGGTRSGNRPEGLREVGAVWSAPRGEL